MLYYSPAKINLSLNVLGKRSDGYHELETVMQAVDLFDTLDITLSEKDIFSCSTLDGPNLVVEARDLFRRKTGWNKPLSILLHKQIPVQAGLGGGSGNAATTLWALSQLSGKSIDDATLLNWSAEIGSDIPFFFSSGKALCKGRGEIVISQQVEDAKWWIVKPAVSLSTKDVFQKFEGSKSLKNDLEPIALELKPSLQMLKRSLERQGCREVTMSGSGTAFYCCADKAPQLDECSLFAVRAISRQESQWYKPVHTVADHA